MKKYTLGLLILLCLTIMSCGSDDDGGGTVVTPAPKADFSFAIDGKTATFTDASTDATSYEWDFGDGNSSTEASPAHTYEGNGSYVAKLTVTNETGTDSKQDVLEIINVAVDGDFSDWDSVEKSVSPSSGTITCVKFENLENNKLFIYVQGTEDLTPLTQILLNVDNDRTTGAFIEWLYFEAGEDLLIEGALTAGPDQAGSIYTCAPCDGSSPGNWNWGADPVNSDIASFMEASELKSIPGGNAYELAIDLTALGQTIASDAIGVAVLDVDINSWGPVGSAPDFYEETDNPEGTLHTYTFK